MDRRALAMGWAACLLMLPLLVSAAVPLIPADCLDPSLGSGGGLQAFPSSYHVISSAQPETTLGMSKVSFAQEFAVTYYDTYKVVTNLRVKESYALYQCGMPVPSVEAGTKVFRVPLTSVSLADASAGEVMRVLGVQDRVAFTDEYAVDPCLQTLGKFGCKKLTSTASPDNFDSFMTYGANSSDPKSIAFTAARDPGVLNRLEWLKFLAPFFNKEDVANAKFTELSQAYEATKAAVAAVAPTDAAARPLVAWMLYLPGGPSWNESVQISFAPYKMEYTQAAGGRNLDAAAALATAQKYDPTATLIPDSSLTLNDKANRAAMLRDVLKDVDVLIEESLLPDTRNADVTIQSLLKLYGLATTDLQTLKFFKNGKIARLDASSNPDDYTGWFGEAVVRPDIVLKELAAIITPAAATGNAAPRFVRVLSQPVMLLRATQCNTLNNCVFNVQPICPQVFKACDGTIQTATATQRCAPTCPTTTATTPAPATTTTPKTGAAGLATPRLLLLVLAGLLALLV